MIGVFIKNTILARPHRYHMIQCPCHSFRILLCPPNYRLQFIIVWNERLLWLVAHALVWWGMPLNYLKVAVEILQFITFINSIFIYCLVELKCSTDIHLLHWSFIQTHFYTSHTWPWIPKCNHPRTAATCNTIRSTMKLRTTTLDLILIVLILLLGYPLHPYHPPLDWTTKNRWIIK